MLMAYRKTPVTPLLTHWSYSSALAMELPESRDNSGVSQLR